MTSKSDVSPANWAALVDAAPAIARAVSASGRSTGQSEQELDAFVQFASNAAVDSGDESLLGALVSDVVARLAVGVPPPDGDVRVDGLEKARRAGAILAVELDPADAASIRAWYLAGARIVATAVKEGGLLGIGAAAVSDWEHDTFQALADALGEHE